MVSSTFTVPVTSKLGGRYSSGAGNLHLSATSLGHVKQRGMNGWETLEALRKLAPDIPVFLASGYDKARVLAGDHPERPQAFLSKPCRMESQFLAVLTAT